MPLRKPKSASRRGWGIDDWRQAFHRVETPAIRLVNALQRYYESTDIDAEALDSLISAADDLRTVLCDVSQKIPEITMVAGVRIGNLSDGNVYERGN